MTTLMAVAAALLVIAELIHKAFEIDDRLHVGARLRATIGWAKTKLHLNRLHLPEVVQFIGPGYSAWLALMFALLVMSVLSLAYRTFGPDRGRPATAGDIATTAMTVFNIYMAIRSFDVKSPKQAKRDLERQYSMMDRLQRIEKHLLLVSQLMRAERGEAIAGATPADAGTSEIQTTDGQIPAAPPVRTSV